MLLTIKKWGMRRVIQRNRTVVVNFKEVEPLERRMWRIFFVFFFRAAYGGFFSRSDVRIHSHRIAMRRRKVCKD